MRPDLHRLKLPSVVAAVLFVAAQAHAAPREAIRPVVIRVDAAVARSSEAAVRTLAEAVALVPGLRSRGGVGPIVIELAPGIHRLAEAVRIGASAGGRPGAPLVIRGTKNGTTRVTGSVPLERIETAAPPGSNAAVRDRIVSYRLPRAAAGAASVDVHRIHSKPSGPVGFELFDDAGALVPARWPDQGWATTKVAAGTEKRGELEVDPERAARWLKERDLWIHGYFGEDWSFESLPVVVSASPGRLITAVDPLYGMRNGARFYVSHALVELDQPGEWWRDVKAGRVHVIPRSTAGTAVEASVADTLLDIDGAAHVVVEDLTFERSRGDAVRVSGGSHVIFQRCVVRWTGGRGIVFDDAGMSGIRQSAIMDTGEGGVALKGGDRATLSRSGLFVEDTVITRFARLGRTYKFAVEVEGVGARVAGNLITDAPHTAIRFQGNDHQIVLNEIANVATETSDAGAIYTGRDIASQGTVVRHNFIHDVTPAPGFEVKGLYLDDMASGITVEANMFLRVQQPVFIGGGRDNTVTGNLFILSSPAVHIDGRGKSWPGPGIDSPENEVHAALVGVPTQSPLWRGRYPRLADLMRDDPAAAKRNAVIDNFVVAGTLLRIESDADRDMQIVRGNTSDADLVPQGEQLDDVARRAQRPAAFAPLLTRMKASAQAAMPLDRMDRASVLARMGVGSVSSAIERKASP